MRDYGQIQCSFWTDPELHELSDQSVLLATYLLTGPHSNGLGCYRLPFGYIQADRGWDNETISKGFAELFRIGFCNRCESTDFVLIPKFLRWNPISNSNVAKAREKEFEAVPKNSSIYKELCHVCLEYGNHWANPLLNRFETLSKGYSQGYGKQEPNRTEPNQNRKEPENIRDIAQSPESEPTTTRANGVPFLDIVKLYHETLPELPACAKLTETRKGYIRQRWQQDLPDLEAWDRYFKIVRQSDFLMGKSQGTDGKPPFRADLEWLTRPTNIVKVIEGKYHRD